MKVQHTRLDDTGIYLFGGICKNTQNGHMIGSTLYMDFESREELDHWLKTDPYTIGGVWGQDRSQADPPGVERMIWTSSLA